MTPYHVGAAFDPVGGDLNSPHRPPERTSPVSTSPEGVGASLRKRKRSSIVDENEEENSSPATARSRHQPGVKRACNECRQQKLRCNVSAGPGEEFRSCDRCIKHKLRCSIDNDFKRLGKRAAHEEMVRELEECKAKLAQYEALGISIPDGLAKPGAKYTGGSIDGLDTSGAPVAPMTDAPFVGPSEAAASRSLLDLSQGYRELPPASIPSIVPGTTPQTLRHVTLSDDELTDLYGIYFMSFHPFLPVLSRDLNYSQYFSLHPLLHWTIIATAARRYEPKPGLLMELHQPLEDMLWTTLSQVPQVYHVCKALALLCTWPLPTSSTSQEATMMLTGAMFQLAMQYGLHRPSHAQDFSRFRVDLREEDIADRLNTWAAVNIVAQTVSTGHGQPPLSRWAWYTYGLHLDRMKSELHTRCQIEKFVDTVTRTLFTMQRDHVVEVDQAQRGLQIDMYARELNEMELTIMSTRSSPVETLYLKAAALHLRLSAFFDKPSQPNYRTDLRNLYIAASSLLQVLLDLTPDILHYIPRYLESMMLAGAVTLLKLLNSFYAAHIDVSAGRALFSKTIATLRQLSVRSNDLPQRLAEVMAQLWQISGAGDQQLTFPSSDAGGALRSTDDSLQLRVRCRSSLSVLYDAIWRWRHQARESGRDNLNDAVKHPTAVSVDTQARNTPQPSLAPSIGLGGGIEASTVDNLSWDATFGENAIFDTLGWALDNNALFPSFDPSGAGLAFQT